MILLCLCIYPVLSVYYSTHTEQYLWVVTSAFLEGSVAAGVVLALYFLGFSVLLVLLAAVPSQLAEKNSGSKSSPDEGGAFDKCKVNKLRSRIGDLVFIFCLLGSLTLANVGYLYVILFSHQNTIVQTVAQLALALFKAVCNAVAIPFDPLGHRDKRSSSLLWRKFAFYSFNNVLAPCLVSLIANSQCLFDLFASTAAIVENFDYLLASKQTCVNTSQFSNDEFQPKQGNDDSSAPPPPPIPPTKCYTFSNPTSLVSTYYPPFTYSYQCGASIITNYVPVLIYTFTLQALVTPVVLGFLRLYFSSKDRANSVEESSTTGRLLRFVGLNLEGIMRPLSTAKTGQRLLATGNYTAFVLQVHTCVVRIEKL